jgi:hypothetical protein
MRVRVVLAVSLLAVAVGLAIDMSGSAPRTAGSNRVLPMAFVAVVPAGGMVCQSQGAPPSGAASVRITIGTYGRPRPELRLAFFDPSGLVVSSGRLSAGTAQGVVAIPLSPAHGEAVRACLHVGGREPVALAGENLAASPKSISIDGRPQPGVMSMMFVRGGKESWWQLLGTLTERFGLGKASFFGDWTLPALALLLLGAWVASARLLLRELK